MFKYLTSVRQYTLTFDALLIGHEAGVTSVAWRPAHTLSLSEPNTNSPPTLLSTSTDSSLILWSPTSLSTTNSGSFSSLWTNRQRFGDVGGVKAGGFVGGLWAGGGMQVLGWGWNGSWRRWGATSDAELEWIEIGAVGGHQGPVRGVTWDSTGRFLLSTR
jgi:elongator complex protein 2